MNKKRSEESAGLRLSAKTWEALFRAQVAVMRRMQHGPEFADITMREYDVLFNISRFGEEGARLNTLNSSLLISQPSLSRMIDRLAERGLVERHPSPDDQRGVIVKLSESGQALQRKVGLRHVVEIHRIIGDTLSAAEMQTLMSLSDKLRSALPTEPS